MMHIEWSMKSVKRGSMNMNEKKTAEYQSIEQ